MLEFAAGAIGAWRANRRSADAAERSAAAEEQSARLAHTPKFTGSFEGRRENLTLLIRLDDPDPLDSLAVRLPDEYPITFKTEGGPRVAQIGVGMEVGERSQWDITVGEGRVRASTVTIWVEAVAGSRSWTVPVVIDRPSALRPPAVVL